MPINSVKRTRGRPAYKPTAALRRQVSIGAGGGMRHEEIAMALGIGVDTLRKYFEVEMSVGANMRRMEVLNAMHKAATRKGSTAAARTYLAKDPEFQVPSQPLGEQPSATPAQPLATAGAEPQKVGQPLGKKAQAQADATTSHVGTEWDHLLTPSTPTPPVH